MASTIARPHYARFFLWGYLKSKVYTEVPTTPENMRERIVNACNEIDGDVLRQCVDSFLERINKCIEVEGCHFEHLL